VNVVLLISIAWALLIPAILAATSRTRVRGLDGRLRLAPTDVERLLQGFGARFYGKPDPALARKLEWAGIPFANTPPAWRALLLLAPAAAFAAVFSLMGVSGRLGPGGLILAGAAAFLVRLYVSSRLDNVIDARRKAIAADVPAFMSSFARILGVRRDWVLAFESIAEAAERERAARGAGGALRRRAVRTSDFNPYASELYTGIIALMARKNEGLLRPGAGMSDPDPLLEWALFCDNSELYALADAIRSARASGRALKADQVDNLEDGFRAAREERLNREAADAASRATAVLVIFNLPLLLAAVIVPAVAGAIAAIGS
jgi:hypothetical protein